MDKLHHLIFSEEQGSFVQPCAKIGSLNARLIGPQNHDLHQLLTSSSEWSAPTASSTVLKPSRSRQSASSRLSRGTRAGPSYAMDVQSSTSDAPAMHFQSDPTRRALFMATTGNLPSCQDLFHPANSVMCSTGSLLFTT